MHTFEITIQRRIERKIEGKLVLRWPVVVEWTAPGIALPMRREVDLGLDPNQPLSPTLSPCEYGIELGRAVFHDGMRDAFTDALARATDCLHILLYVEAEEWKAMRWERLAAPVDDDIWTPLALNQQTPFAIHLPSVTARRYDAITRDDLRALIVAASPIPLPDGRLAPEDEGWGLAHFDVVETVRGVRTALERRSIESDVLTAAPLEPWKGPPTLDTLCNAISGRSYAFLHVVCHGAFIPADRESILFVLKQAEHEVEAAPDVTYYPLDAVPASRLIDRLRSLNGTHGLPHFMFLSVCGSASTAAEDMLGGLAQRLVRELGIPAVVAMTEKVSISTATALSGEFYGRLLQHGMPDLALVQAFSGLAERSDIQVPVLCSRLSGQPLFRTVPSTKLTDAVIAHGVDIIEESLPERAPILKGEFREHAETLLRIRVDEVERLPGTRRRRYGRALSGIDALCREVFERSFPEVARDEPLPAYDPRCPFRGLGAFNPFRPKEEEDPHDNPEDDPQFFTGRDTWVKTLLNRLEEHNFLAALGASGSGKSSVVLAGVVPALMRRAPGRRPALMTPGREPLDALHKALAAAGLRPVAIVVDQFEEAFTLCRDDDARAGFFDALLDAAGTTRVIITMRADFWGDCDRHDDLREAIKGHQELIPSMKLEELREAMLHQAKEVGLRFETGLVGAILDDLDPERTQAGRSEGRAGSMPLVQHALRELWKRRHGRGLRGEEYEALGRVQGAIAHTAEDVFGRLDDPEKALVRHVFLRLVRLDDDPAPGERPRDTRRRASLEDLVPVDGDLGNVRTLINALANHRLVVTKARGDDRAPDVEVIHEALITQWPRLKQWISENRADLKLRQEIDEDAEAWEKSKRDESFLNHRGPRLVAVEQLEKNPNVQLSQSEQDYIEACVAHREAVQAKIETERVAKERRRRWTKIGLATGLGLFAALSIIAVFWRNAVYERGRAESALGAAKTAQGEAEHQRQRADRFATELTIDRGISLCQEGRTDDGLLWLMRGLKQVHQTKPPDPALDHLARLELATWRPATTSLRWFQRSSTSVRVVAYSPDGRTAMTGGEEGTAQLWDVGSGRPKGPPFKHDGGINAVAYSPDGRTALIARFDGTARLWDLDSAQAKGPPLEHGGVVGAMAISPDGRTALTGSFDGTAQLWDLDSAQAKGPPFKHDGWVRAVAISPDGRTALTGSDDKTARLWDLDSARPKGPLLRHDGRVTAVAYSPDGRTALTGSSDKTARLWDLDSARPKGPPLRHDGRVTAVAYSPDGRTALTGSFDGTAQLWDVDSAQAKGPPLKHGGRVRAVAISPDGRTALTGSFDGTARLWDVDSARAKGPPLKHGDSVGAVAYSPDGRTVLTGSVDRTARLWNVSTQQPVGFPLDHGAAVFSADYGPDGTVVLTSGNDGTAQLWLAQTQRPIGTRFSHEGPISAAEFSPDGRWIATASGDRTARLWRTPSPIEGSLERLGLWVRVVTMKEMDDFGAIRSLDLETWQRYRQNLEDQGGPPDRPATSGATASRAR
jgi:WD40 repeat protein